MKMDLLKLLKDIDLHNMHTDIDNELGSDLTDRLHEAIEDLESKVNNVVLDDVNNGFYCHDELVNNMLNHNGGKCKEQCKSCINDMQEK